MSEDKKVKKRLAKDVKRYSVNDLSLWRGGRVLWKGLKKFFWKKFKKIKKRFDKAKKKVPNGELSHLWKRVEKLFFPLSKFFKVLERKKIKFEKKLKFFLDRLNGLILNWRLSFITKEGLKKESRKNDLLKFTKYDCANRHIFLKYVNNDLNKNI